MRESVITNITERPWEMTCLKICLVCSKSDMKDVRDNYENARCEM